MKDQLGRERGEACLLALGPPKLQRDVLAFDVPVVSESESKRGDVGSVS